MKSLYTPTGSLRRREHFEVSWLLTYWQYTEGMRDNTKEYVGVHKHRLAVWGAALGGHPPGTGLTRPRVRVGPTPSHSLLLRLYCECTVDQYTRNSIREAYKLTAPPRWWETDQRDPDHMLHMLVTCYVTNYCIHVSNMLHMLVTCYVTNMLLTTVYMLVTCCTSPRICPETDQ